MQYLNKSFSVYMGGTGTHEKAADLDVIFPDREEARKRSRKGKWRKYDKRFDPQKMQNAAAEAVDKVGGNETAEKMINRELDFEEIGRHFEE